MLTHDSGVHANPYWIWFQYRFSCPLAAKGGPARAHPEQSLRSHGSLAMARWPTHLMMCSAGVCVCVVCSLFGPPQEASSGMAWMHRRRRRARRRREGGCTTACPECATSRARHQGGDGRRRDDGRGKAARVVRQQGRGGAARLGRRRANRSGRSRARGHPNGCTGRCCDRGPPGLLGTNARAHAGQDAGDAADTERHEHSKGRRGCNAATKGKADVKTDAERKEQRKRRMQRPQRRQGKNRNEESPWTALECPYKDFRTTRGWEGYEPDMVDEGDMVLRGDVPPKDFARITPKDGPGHTINIVSFSWV